MLIDDNNSFKIYSIQVQVDTTNCKVNNFEFKLIQWLIESKLMLIDDNNSFKIDSIRVQVDVTNHKVDNFEFKLIQWLIESKLMK